MNKIFITGDTHGNFTRLSHKNWPEGKTLDKDDFVIICGDFGGIWLNKSDKDEIYKLNWLNEKPWTTLFVDGNHENFIRLNRLPKKEKFGGLVGEVRESILHLRRGQIYYIAGKLFFAFGGGKSIDKIWRTPFISWWPEEEPTTKELDNGLLNLQSYFNRVDYVITHTAPESILKKLGEIALRDYGEKKESLTKYFEHVMLTTNFDRWFFGHFHEDGKVGEKFQALYKSIVQIQ